MPDLLELRQAHVIDLVEANALHLTWCATWNTAEAFPLLREVIVPMPHTGAQYLVCLHELGHVLAPGAQELESQPADVFTNLAAEGLAWAWAASVARSQLLEPGDWQIATTALQTHYGKLEASPMTIHGAPCDTPTAPLA